jgi:hypothetical protein
MVGRLFAVFSLKQQSMKLVRVSGEPGFAGLDDGYATA